MKHFFKHIHLTWNQAALNDDPFDVEAQKRIEDAIRQENIAANLEAAMEYNPESFARVNISINILICSAKANFIVNRSLVYTSMWKLTTSIWWLLLIQVLKAQSVSQGIASWRTCIDMTVCNS